MKKTLKILMAIILFAVVLTIATSVSAATTRTYATLEEAVEKEDELATKDTTYKKVIEEDNGYYVVNDVTDVDLEITNTITVSDMKLVLNGDMKATGGVVVNGKLVISQDTGKTGNLTGDVQVAAKGVLETSVALDKVINKGTVYATELPGDYSGVGEMYTTKAFTATATNTALTLKEAVENDKVEYTNVVVAIEGLEDKISYKVTSIVPENEVAAVNKVEAEGVYTLTVVAYYNFTKELAAPAVTLDNAEMPRGEEVNCTVAGTTMTVKAEDELTEGAKAIISAQLAGLTDTKKNVEIGTIGVEIENPGETPVDPEDPTDPENPGETPVDPEQPANPGEEDLDPDVPNTGDHIIPATAILAVVVVANVVYFAKMKRN